MVQFAEVNKRTVRRQIQDGRLEAHRGSRFKGGLLYLITGYEIMRWLVIKETGFDLYGFSCLPFRLGDEAALKEPVRYLTIDQAKKEFEKVKIDILRYELMKMLESGEVEGFLENGYWLVNSGSLWEYINSLKSLPSAAVELTQHHFQCPLRPPLGGLFEYLSVVMIASWMLKKPTLWSNYGFALLNHQTSRRVSQPQPQDHGGLPGPERRA